MRKNIPLGFSCLVIEVDSAVFKDYKALKTLEWLANSKNCKNLASRARTIKIILKNLP